MTWGKKKKSQTNQEMEISQKEVKRHLECFQKKRLDDELHGKIKHGSLSFVPRRYDAC